MPSGAVHARKRRRLAADDHGILPLDLVGLILTKVGFSLILYGRASKMRNLGKKKLLKSRGTASKSKVHAIV
jgi:hypothetical protein